MSKFAEQAERAAQICAAVATAVFLSSGLVYLYLGRWLTYWTTLLFPLAVLARTLGGSVTGRDFDSAANSLTLRLFAQIMALERSLLRRTSRPIGGALLAAARKSYGGIRSLAK